MKKTKIFAAYLPQYHETPENNMFWGKGFTDWTTVKNAVPLFSGHQQPRIPKDGFYYDLSNTSVLYRQANMAKKYSVDGFNIYHYWFKDGHKVLYKPAELLLTHKDIDIEFFFTWDNSSWRRTWSNVVGNAWSPLMDGSHDNNEEEGHPYLLEMKYGDKQDWKEHFEYLLPYFKDSRYLKINNCPVFMFHTNIEIETLKEMVVYWSSLAKENGFPGLFHATGKGPFFRHVYFDAEFLYQPIHAGWSKWGAITTRFRKLFRLTNGQKQLHIYKYDVIWKRILRDIRGELRRGNIVGCFVRYDDTPRRGGAGSVVLGDTSEKFKKYFRVLYDCCCEYEAEIVLVTAWNEWGEGAYLEPDEDCGYAYLEAIRHVVSEHIIVDE